MSWMDAAGVRHDPEIVFPPEFKGSPEEKDLREQLAAAKIVESADKLADVKRRISWRDADGKTHFRTSDDLPQDVVGLKKELKSITAAHGLAQQEIAMLEAERNKLVDDGALDPVIEKYAAGVRAQEGQVAGGKYWRPDIKLAKPNDTFGAPNDLADHLLGKLNPKAARDGDKIADAMATLRHDFRPPGITDPSNAAFGKNPWTNAAHAAVEADFDGALVHRTLADVRNNIARAAESGTLESAGSFARDWFNSGFPTFELTGGLATALCVTETRGLKGSDFQTPFGAMAIQMPGASPLLFDGRPVRFILTDARHAFSVVWDNANDKHPIGVFDIGRGPGDDETIEHWLAGVEHIHVVRFFVNVCVYITSLHALPAPDSKPKKPGAGGGEVEAEVEHADALGARAGDQTLEGHGAGGEDRTDDRRLESGALAPCPLHGLRPLAKPVAR